MPLFPSSTDLTSPTEAIEAPGTAESSFNSNEPAVFQPTITVPVISGEDRYSRQILFPGIGTTGQQLLASAHVAIVGCGATGAATASLLARAGVGTLTLIDRDFVEPSNLQRQILFDEADAQEGLPKAEAARRKIALFNSSVTVYARIADLTPASIGELFGPACTRPIQLILDATDNFETRYLINDFAIRESTPWIYAAAIGAYAATMNILPAPSEYRTACLACIFPKPPTGPVETCDTSGILSTAVNLAASFQANEALKLLTGQSHLMRRTLLSFDLWSLSDQGTLERSEISTANPRPDCIVCGDRVFSHLAGEGRPHITLCGRNSVQIHERNRPLELPILLARLRQNADLHDLRANDLLLRFKTRRGDHTVTLFADGRAVIQGTTDVMVARSLYARFIGS